MWRKEFEANVKELTKSLRVEQRGVCLYLPYHLKKVGEFNKEVKELEQKFEEEFN